MLRRGERWRLIYENGNSWVNIREIRFDQVSWIWFIIGYITINKLIESLQIKSRAADVGTLEGNGTHPFWYL